TAGAPAFPNARLCGRWVVGLALGRVFAEGERSRLQILDRHVCASTPVPACSGEYQTSSEILPGYGRLEIWRRPCRINSAAVCKGSPIYSAANQLGEPRFTRVLDCGCSCRAASVCRNA